MFTIDGNRPLQTYELGDRVTRFWSNVEFQLYIAEGDGTGSLLVDDIYPYVTSVRTKQCLAPTVGALALDVDDLSAQSLEEAHVAAQGMLSEPAPLEVAPVEVEAIVIETVVEVAPPVVITEEVIPPAPAVTEEAPLPTPDAPAVTITEEPAIAITEEPAAE